MERIRHKYESDATMDLVYHQIEQALEKMDSSSMQNREKSKAVLKRYVDGEIGLDEAYYELSVQELALMRRWKI